MAAALPRFRVDELGDLLVTRYDMRRGDTVPMHTHTPESEHITIVALGAISLKGPNLDKRLEAGEMFDYAADQQTHEIVAVSDSAVVFNIPKKKAPTE